MAAFTQTPEPRETMKKDILIIGAGPAGLSFARSLKDSGLNAVVIEKAPLEALRDPRPDGREIALTHLSVKLMKDLGAWPHIPDDIIAPIREAKVLNGNSPYYLDFDLDNVDADALGYLVPNHWIRRAFFNEAETLDNVELITGKGRREPDDRLERRADHAGRRHHARRRTDRRGGQPLFDVPA